MKSPTTQLIRCTIIACFALTSSCLLKAEDAPAPAAAPAAAGAAPADVTAALAMPAGPDRRKAASTAAQAWAKTDPTGFLNWIFAQDPKQAADAFPGIPACATGPDPKTYADIIVKNVEGGPNMPQFHGFMLGWSGKDMAAAQAYVLQPSLPRDSHYLGIFTVADMLVRKDATGKSAAAWTASIPAGEARNAAIDGTTCIWLRGDPISATAWIKTLSPDDMKWAVMLGANYYGPAKAKLNMPLEDWVKQFPLSDADKDAIIKGPRPDTYHISKFQAAPAPAK